MGNEKKIYDSSHKKIIQSQEWKEILGVIFSAIQKNVIEKKSVVELQGALKDIIDENIWESNVNDVVAIISKLYQPTMKKIEDSIWRSITIDDLQYLQKSSLDDIMCQIGERWLKDSNNKSIFLWLQCAYIEVYRANLYTREYGFTEKQQRSFEKIVAVAMDRKASFQEFVSAISLWEKNNVWLRDNQIQILHNAVKYIWVQDIIHWVAKNNLLSDEEKKTFSKKWVIITENGDLQNYINDALIVYNNRYENNRTNIESNIDVWNKDFVSPNLQDILWSKIFAWEDDVNKVLCDYDPVLFQNIQDSSSVDERRLLQWRLIISYVKDKDKVLWSFLEVFLRHNNNFALCPHDIQKQYISYIKDFWKQTSEYKRAISWFTQETKLVPQDILNDMVEELFDVSKNTITIPLWNQEVLTMPCRKKIIPTVYDQNASWLLSQFNISIPLKIEVFDLWEDGKPRWHKGEIYDLSSWWLSRIIWHMSLAYNSVHQTVAEKQESYDEYIADRQSFLWEKQGNVLSNAIKQANKSNKIYMSDEDVVDDLFVTKTNSNIQVPTFSSSEIAENLALSLDEKVKKWIMLLDNFALQNNEKSRFSTLSVEQQERIKKSIIDADTCTIYHNSDSAPDWCLYDEITWTYHEQGKICWLKAAWGLYTKEQIKRKARILQEAGLSREQITVLLRAGIAWISIKDKIQEDLLQLESYKQSIEEQIKIAKQKLIEAENNIPHGWVSLTQYRQDIARIDNQVKYLQKARDHLAQIRNDVWRRSRLSDSEKQDRADRDAQLEKDIHTALENKAELETQINEVELYLKPYHEKIKNLQWDLLNIQTAIDNKTTELENADDDEPLEQKKEKPWDSIEWKLKSIWWSLPGYTNPSSNWLPSSWDQLFLRYSTEIWGGLNFGSSWSLWVRCVVDSVDIKTWDIKIAFYGVTWPLTENEKNIEWDVRSFSLNSFESFLSNSLWEDKIKMPKYDEWISMKQWWVQLKQQFNQYTFANEEVKKRIDNLLSQVDFASMEKQNPATQQQEKIKYMWRPISTEHGNPDFSKEWYEIEYVTGNNTVKVSEPMLWSKSNIGNMTYDAFLLFCADKWLQPYTQQEVDVMNIDKWAWKNYVDQGIMPGWQDASVMNKVKWLGWLGIKWGTLHSVAFGFKKIKEWITKKLDTWKKDDEENLRWHWASSSWMKKISSAWIPLISEVFDEWSAGVVAEWDRKKLAKIDEFEKHPDNYKDTTPGWPFDYIEAVLFKNPDAARRKKDGLLKIAWYFQYCLKKWELYPRSLNGPSTPPGYKDQAMWTRLLLWPQRQQIYKDWYIKQKLLSEKDPENLDLKNRVLYGEAYFLSKVVGEKNFEGAWVEVSALWWEKAWTVIIEQLQGIYSKAWLWWLLDKAIEWGMGAQSKIASKKDELNKKEWVNFSWLYGDVFSSFENKWVPGAMWHLDPMARKMKKNEEYYEKRAMCMLYPILSWQTQYALTEWSIKAEYMSLSRQYAFPLWLYAWGTPNGRWELVKLLTLFEKKMGWNTPSPSIATIVDELGNKTDTASLKKFTKSLQKRWGWSTWWEWKDMWQNATYGKMFLKYMSDPNMLFSTESELQDTPPTLNWQKIDQQEAANYKRVLWSYIDTKFVDKDISEVAEGKLDAVALKKNVWSLSPWFIRTYMWQRQGRSSAQFSQKVIEHVPGIWDELTKQLDLFVTRKNDLSEREVSFLMNKFFMFMNTNNDLTIDHLLYSIYAPSTMEFVSTAGKKSTNVGSVKADIMWRAITKQLDKRSIEWHNLPPAIRKNISRWIELLKSSSFQSHLPWLIEKKKITELNDSNRVIAKMSDHTGGKTEAAKERFMKKFNKKHQMKVLEQNFGDGEYSAYEDDDDDD